MTKGMDADMRAQCEALWREWCRDQPLEPLPNVGSDGPDGIIEYHGHVAHFIECRPLREANRLLRGIGAFFRENGGLLDVRFPPIDEALELCRETERLGRPLTGEERQATVAAVRQREKAISEQLFGSRSLPQPLPPPPALARQPRAGGQTGVVTAGGRMTSRRRVKRTYREHSLRTGAGSAISVANG